MSIKEKAYDTILRASMAFPYSNDLMHTGLMGTVPFLLGKYVSSRFIDSDNLTTAIGLAASAVSELVWRFGIEPSSPYDHSTDIIGDNKGSLEAAIGALIGFGITKIPGLIKH